MRTHVELGEVELPQGVLLLLDPGLARFWRHDGDPASPRRSDPPAHDLQIVGRDAEAAGRAYDREFAPCFLFDVRDPEQARNHFDAFARKSGFDCRAEVLTSRVPHTLRVRSALEAGKGLGVVKYNGFWAVAAEGLPTGRPLPVVGVPIPEGEFGGRWASIDVVVQENAEVARTDRVAGITVEHGELLFAGLEPLGHFRMWTSLDGLADYVFWGEDAARVAQESGAQSLGRDLFGWKDLPEDQVTGKARPLQSRIEQEGLRLVVDYRPHCNLERLHAQVRERESEFGQLVLGGARVVGGSTRWGDGVFEVSRHFDAGGRLIRVSVELGTERRQHLLRQMRLRQRQAIVTRVIRDGEQPIRFAERMKPSNPSDSGWAFSSGTENAAYMKNASNLCLMRLQQLVDRFPELAAILDAPVGALYRREGDQFVEDAP